MSIYETSDTASYAVRSDGYAAERAGHGKVGEQVFLWLAWSLAFAFWALTMRTFFGILEALGSGVPGGF